ncbi:type II secretion system F family protein [Aneurinibacillus tyrosinisolvens]|uniref:type II secretion system F family protein n=1 Tax=Aneurinibacillus tyrosinisolvens TaxID=1443435 RepID=UPI00063F1C6E|nr:hypothetical protein [Aneurinibacillus tyrosinisolvens]
MQLLSGLVLTGASLFFLLYSLLVMQKPAEQKRSIKLMKTAGLFEQRLDDLMGKNERAFKINQYVTSLLSKSRIRIKGKPLNKYIFYVILAITSLIVGYLSTKSLNNIYAGIMLTGFAGYLFFHLLGWDAKHRKRKLKKQAPSFYLTMTNFYEIRSDAMWALQETVKKIKNPLKVDLQFFINQLNRPDGNIREAVLEAKARLDNKQLRDFLDDFELQLRFGGSFRNTLHQYVQESIEKEVQSMEQSSETSATVMITYFLIGLFCVMAVMMRNSQPEAMSLLVTTPAGKVVVVAMICIILAVLYVTKEMTDVGEE